LIDKTQRNMAKENQIPTEIAGVSGEYFVAAELSRRGHIASISLKNTSGVDVLATNDKASRHVTIQCKTTRSKEKYWLLNKKSEGFISENHFYVFVNLGELLERPEFHIVPSIEVARRITERNRKWNAGLKRDGTKRKDNDMRIFTDKECQYLEKWELLGL
jgi:hypothetical protein